MCRTLIGRECKQLSERHHVWFILIGKRRRSNSAWIRVVGIRDILLGIPTGFDDEMLWSGGDCDGHGAPKHRFIIITGVDLILTGFSRICIMVKAV